MRPVNLPSFSSPKIPVDVPEMEQSLLPRTEGEGTSGQPDKKGPAPAGRIFRATADFLSTWQGGNTPLHLAINQGDLDAVQSLLAKHANPDIKNKSGRTPLSYAAEKGHPGIVKALLGNPNVKPDTVDKDGRTPLSYAVAGGHLDIVKTLLANSRVKPDLADNNGRTPLSYAAEKGRFDIVKDLQEAKASPNLPDKNGRTPLSYAAENDHVGAVRALLENDHIIPDMRGPDGKTPLHHAAANNHPNVVDALLNDARVAPNLQDKHGLTPLAGATLKDQFNTVATLLKDARVDPNLADAKGYTPLHHAAEKGGPERLRITDALLRNGRLNPNLQEKEHGYTALACAVLKNDPHVSKALLANQRVDVNLSDNQGRTPFFLATIYNDSNVIDLSVLKALLEHDRVAHHQRANSGKTAFENLLDGPINMHPAYTYAMAMLENVHVRQGIRPDILMQAADKLRLYSDQRSKFGIPEQES